MYRLLNKTSSVVDEISRNKVDYSVDLGRFGRLGKCQEDNAAIAVLNTKKAGG